MRVLILFSFILSILASNIKLEDQNEILNRTIRQMPRKMQQAVKASGSGIVAVGRALGLGGKVYFKYILK